MSDELSRLVREMNMGRSPEQALSSALKRMPSEDFELILTAVTIHSEVGGNLARVFDNVSHTIRERVRVKGQISALTAQARMSGWIITLLPIVLGLVLYVITPAYFRSMVDHPIGWAMLVLAAFSIVVGNAIIRRMIAIKV
jgi:tight adherence protein B